MDKVLKKLPIGIQSFRKLRQGNYLYIDKTRYAYELITNHNYVFLSRPRRFGKSLFLDTLREIFQGSKELFEGLWIYNNWDWSVKFPVIKISFTGSRSREELINDISRALWDNMELLGVDCKTDDYAVWFNELIKSAYRKHGQPVVILIDEYDKPILDNLDQLDVAKESREILRRLYGQLKDADEYIRFVFLTGVSKFSRASIFSGLNMLEDITLSPPYGDICGITQQELETQMIDYFKGVDLEKVKEWYNGYYFLKSRLYNPFDLLLFIQNAHQFDCYWFQTGTPSFLIKLIERNNFFLPELSNLTVGKALLDSFDVESIRPEVVMFQAGYLTIDEVIESPIGYEFRLKLPNKEVRIALSQHLLEYLTQQVSRFIPLQNKIYEALVKQNLEGFKEELKTLFASLPYTNYIKNKISSYEGYYASLMYVLLSSLGFEVIGEDVTNRGRIDLTVKTNNTIYIMEFKLTNTGSSQNGLIQLKQKKYYEKYVNTGKKLCLVAIEFDPDERNIKELAWEWINS